MATVEEMNNVSNASRPISVDFACSCTVSFVQGFPIRRYVKEFWPGWLNLLIAFEIEGETHSHPQRRRQSLNS